MLALCKFLRDKYSLAAVSNISEWKLYILFCKVLNFLIRGFYNISNQ